MAKQETARRLFGQAPALIYPGAIGWGVETRGGRGGRVIRVTTTADGERQGTLRYALEVVKEPRTVVFDVGGVFRLNGTIMISGANLTVLGQTAPFPGVNIRGQIRLRTDDVLLQHLTIWGQSGNDDMQQCIDLLGNERGCRRIIIDHCTLMWGWSKMLQTWSGEHALNGSGGVDYVTVSNCLIAEPLLGPKQDSHRGLIFQEYTHHGTVLRNLFASCELRAPAFHQATSVAVVNNLAFNPGVASIHYWPCPDNYDPVIASIVGNVVIPGPSTSAGGRRIDIGQAYSGSKIYIADNSAPGGVSVETKSAQVQQRQAWPSQMNVLPTDKVEAHLIAEVGAHPWQRESAAKRVIADLERRRSRWADTISGYGGYPEYGEVKRVLNLPANPSEIGADGYSNLERWVWQMNSPLKNRIYLPGVKRSAWLASPSARARPEDLDLRESLVVSPASSRPRKP